VHSSIYQRPIIPGQHWRLVTPSQAEILTIDHVADGTVHAFMTPEQAPGTTMAWVGAPADLAEATLLSEPGLERFLVVAQVDYEDPGVRRAIDRVGAIESFSSVGLVEGEAKGPLARVWVVARDEEEAIKRVSASLAGFSVGMLFIGRPIG
jgi:hypothetical protein